MNNTKWEELRLAMHGLGVCRPFFRVKDRCGSVSSWAREWFYHFREGGYETVEWAELRPEKPEHEQRILTILRDIHLPGQRIENGYRIYGYVSEGQFIDYI